MLNLNDFRDYIKSIETEISEISNSETVMDQTQLSKFLDNQVVESWIVLGIVPKHNFKGSDVNLQSNDSTSLLVLQKVVRSSQDQEIFLDSLSQTQRITELVINKMIDDYENDDSCNMMSNLILSSVDINPIWRLNSCDGYQVDFSLKTKI